MKIKKSIMIGSEGMVMWSGGLTIGEVCLAPIVVHLTPKKRLDITFAVCVSKAVANGVEIEGGWYVVTGTGGALQTLM